MKLSKCKICGATKNRKGESSLPIHRILLQSKGFVFHMATAHPDVNPNKVDEYAEMIKK